VIQRNPGTIAFAFKNEALLRRLGGPWESLGASGVSGESFGTHWKVVRGSLEAPGGLQGSLGRPGGFWGCLAACQETCAWEVM
jgi:hypothetical protein